MCSQSQGGLFWLIPVSSLFYFWCRNVSQDVRRGKEWWRQPKSSGQESSSPIRHPSSCGCRQSSNNNSSTAAARTSLKISKAPVQEVRQIILIKFFANKYNNICPGTTGAVAQVQQGYLPNCNRGICPNDTGAFNTIFNDIWWPNFHLKYTPIVVPMVHQDMDSLQFHFSLT